MSLKYKSKLLFNILSSVAVFAIFSLSLPYISKGLSFSKHLWDNQDWNNYKYAEEDVDILIIGNSHVRTGINPLVISDLTGENVELLSAGAMNLPWAYYGLEEILQRKVPEVIVIESYLYDVRARNAAYTPIARTIYGDNVIKALPALTSVMDWSSIPYAWSPIVRYHDQWNQPISQFYKNITTDYADINWRWNGYEYQTAIVGQVKYDTLLGTMNPARAIPKNYPYYTEKILELGDEYGIPIIFIKVPAVDCYGVYDAVVAEIIQNAGGTFYDFNTYFLDETKYLKIHFKDAGGTPINSHQNNIGAIKSSVYLADLISQETNIVVNEENRDSVSELFLARVEIKKKEEEGVFQIRLIMEEEMTNLNYSFELLKSGNSLITYDTDENIWIVEESMYRAAKGLHFKITSNENDFFIEGLLGIN